MTVQDLKFRYYNGEKDNPFIGKNPQERYWEQESTVAARPKLAIQDFSNHAWERDFEYPITALIDYLGKVEDGSFAVALSGFLNTKQWGIMAYELDDYFDAPINGYVATPEEDADEEA